MLAMVTAVVCFAVPASAAGFTPLTTLKDDTYVTFRKTAFADFVWIGGVYFEEGKITERDALGWLIDGASSSGINPYRFDTKIDYSKENILTAEDDPDHTKYGFWSSVLPAAAVDDTMYHLFGIKPRIR